MIFADRHEAGRLLGERLAHLRLKHPVVLALPRGGVSVGFEVAQRLGAPLDVFVARKIGHPNRPEFGVGALAEEGEPVLDEPVLSRLGLDVSVLKGTIECERRELARRVRPTDGAGLRRSSPGAAWCSSTTALLPAARPARRCVPFGGEARGASSSRSPVGAPETTREMLDEADDVVALGTPPSFGAIGAWYEDFHQVSDDQVLHLPGEARGAPA